MKTVLGLDLGTNSIGWAVIQKDDEGRAQKIVKLGSRIIPMSQDVLSKFDSGVTESQTAIRTSYRSMRRLRERHLLRRERLHRVLHVLGFLPPHYDNALGWDKTQGKTYGKFLDDTEPKLAWAKDIQGRNRFIFMDSFTEMVRDFQQNNPELMANGKSIPMDWTLYYLRDKALRAPITRQELAWLLLNFNQKRGYYQLRGEEETEDTSKLVEYHVLKVVSVEETAEKRGKDTWYNVKLENGWVYRRSSRISLADWVGKTREFIVTTELEADGSVKLDKEGKERRSFRAPDANDWNLQKKRTEADIETSGTTVGSFIYHHLLTHPEEKVKGKLVRTIERKYYKNELKAILKKQSEFLPELTCKEKLDACICELYAHNQAHQDSLRCKDISYLLVEDLVFYQRPLKSKKSLISNCPYESYKYVDKETGEIKIQPIKCIAKSNPFYQEFRLWQFIQNLRIFSCEGIDEKEVTADFLKNEDDYVRLFYFLNDRKEITQDILMKDFFELKKSKGKDSKYSFRWNYVEDKAYPCNETRYIMLKALKKIGLDSEFLKEGMEYRLWHLLYSVEDKQEIVKSLTKLATKAGLDETFTDAFIRIPSFKKEYGAYSEKAIKKLLSVMRIGELWKEDFLPKDIVEHYQQFVNEKTDLNIQDRINQENIALVKPSDFRGLPLWMACYAVYGRHSEAKDISRWKNPEDLSNYLRHEFKQYSMRNPIVEQCVLETLRTVHDIWQQYGKIDEIHVELGRNMKSTSDQRKRMSQHMLANENTNMRIKQLLMELKNDNNIKDVRPYSPMQQDILRIYEEGALQKLRREDPDYDEIVRISSMASPSQNELLRYKLWLEQKYRSPYTGKTISLTKLFTPAYQIEHVIPKARYFDDSFSNKVICEAEVNQKKSNLLGFEFIKNHGGEIVHCPTLGDVRVFKQDEYKSFVTEHYASNKNKARKLMMDDIPEEFLQRQMNDSRYISKTIIGLLSNIVREEGELEATSKHVIPCTGGITDKLKKDWGLSDVWNTIVAPRFQRMNELTGTSDYGHWENKEGKRVFQTTMPLELQKGFSKKRIDHRHHAMDALVIALASRNIVSYLNNESAHDSKRREDLKHQLCGKGQVINKPWNTFTEDALSALQDIVVSFKHYVRIINKASNFYEHYDANGNKKLIAQRSDAQWAIRKPMHKETVYGHVNLQCIDEVSLNSALDQIDKIVDRELRNQILLLKAEGKDKKKIKAYFAEMDNMFNGQSVKKVAVRIFSDDKEPMVATRKELDDTFDAKRILSITDTGIQKILQRYLEAKGGNNKLAFCPEGIMEMNQNIALYNNGKNHKPILRVRVAEPKGEKYNIGQRGNKSKKFVIAQGGTNLYFAVYENAEGKRSFQTIPLNVAAERLKMGWSPVPENNEAGVPLKFWLSPNDLVYVPTEEEIATSTTHLQNERIYKMVSATGNRSFFIGYNIATVLANKIEFQAMNKIEKAISGENIKEVCWKLEVDRLGNIIKITR